MKTPEETIDVNTGSFVVHPPGELHEYSNGKEQTILFRVRYGENIVSRHLEWPNHPNYQRRLEDVEYFENNPV